MKSSTRKQIAADTLAVIEKGSYRNNLGETVSIGAETAAAVAAAELFRDGDFPETLAPAGNETATRFEVTDETTLEAAKRICREDAAADPFVLNFASAKNPGGGFLRGAEAQEESLARSSALYPTLTKFFELYEYNRGRATCLYSDWMIYSPRVPVFRNDDGSLLQKPYLATFLTSPAVNAGVVRRQEPHNVARIEPVNRERARKFLWIANQKRHQTLVLGAWGCGVFQNYPAEIARIFDELFAGEFENRFERVIMAIYDRTPEKKVYGAFAEVFAK
ncbi:MAG: TIGR02452 family protein [Acidobacteria bacterium]|nr:TIGR02452 family protein [Acidobacteriota bacterium]